MYSVLGMLVVCGFAVSGLLGMEPLPDRCANVRCAQPVGCQYGMYIPRGGCCYVCKERPGRPGKCPDQSPFEICITEPACRYDGDCKGGQLCCQNSCDGTICMDPVTPDLPCNYRGTKYPTGAVWRAADECNTCSCDKEGNIFCTETTCNDQPGVCPDLPRYYCFWGPFYQRSYDNLGHECEDHQDCKPGPDTCCTGICGNKQCMRPKTPPNQYLCLTKQMCVEPPACPNTIQRPKDCCPVCPGCSVNGNIQEGDLVDCDSANPCVECVCRGGVIEIRNVECPPLNCPKEEWLKGFCCYYCPEE